MFICLPAHFFKECVCFFSCSILTWNQNYTQIISNKWQLKYNFASLKIAKRLNIDFYFECLEKLDSWVLSELIEGTRQCRDRFLHDYTWSSSCLLWLILARFAQPCMWLHAGNELQIKHSGWNSSNQCVC